MRSDGKSREFKWWVKTFLSPLGRGRSAARGEDGEKALPYDFSHETGPGRLQRTCTPLTIVDPKDHQLLKSPPTPANGMVFYEHGGH